MNAEEAARLLARNAGAPLYQRQTGTSGNSPKVWRLICTCECHDCCVPQWASCGDCDENHPKD